jgi:hypothetical protein
VANEPVSKREFWIGTFLSVITILVSIWVARAPIIAEQEATRRAKAAEQLADLSLAISGVGEQLRSHASMFVEVGACLEKNKERPKACWQRDYDFDPQRSVESWATLGAKEAAIKPYLVTDAELRILKDIGDIQASHPQSIRAMIPPKSPDAAAAISNRILQTEQMLSDKYKSLEEMVSARVREK